MKINKYLAKQMLVALRNTTAGSAIRCFSGPVPDDVDAPATGTYLGAFFTSDSNAVSLDQPVENTVSKPAAQLVWACDPAAAGTATYFRMSSSGLDSPGNNATANDGPARIQGTIGKAGTDMILADPVFVVGVRKELKYFTVTQPLGL